MSWREKVGRPVLRTAEKQARGHIASRLSAGGAAHRAERQGPGREGRKASHPAREPEHPIEIFARAYGLLED